MDKNVPAAQGPWTQPSRQTIRYVAAALAGLISLLYLLIGLQVVSVIDQTEDQAGFAIPAAIAFALGAALLLAMDRRIVWIAGALLQIGMIVMYFVVAPDRSPNFELWGVLIRILQVPLLAALLYLGLAASPKRVPELGGTGRHRLRLHF
jgi:hypothetical protein